MAYRTSEKMIYLERHQKIAIGIFSAVTLYLFIRDDFDQAAGRSLALLATLVPILFYRTIAYFSGFGFPEVFARDYGSENRPGPYALFFWMLYLIVCGFLVFEWSIY